jgi:3-hydroxyacyl-[acyl-carrier-protein] dehydratase
MTIVNAQEGAKKLVEEGQPYTGSIEALLPHRDPFLFVKKLTFVGKDKTVGEMTYTPDIWFFKGHFPSYPVVPGVILVETMAQCGGAGLVASGQVRSGGIFLLAGVDNVKFRHQVRPGDTVRLEIDNVLIKTRIAKQHGKAFIGDTLAAEADFHCVMVPADKVAQQ